MEEKKKKFSGYFKVSSSKYARDLIFFFSQNLSQPIEMINGKW